MHHAQQYYLGWSDCKSQLPACRCAFPPFSETYTTSWTCALHLHFHPTQALRQERICWNPLEENTINFHIKLTSKCSGPAKFLLLIKCFFNLVFISVLLWVTNIIARMLYLKSITFQAMYTYNVCGGFSAVHSIVCFWVHSHSLRIHKGVPLRNPHWNGVSLLYAHCRVEFSPPKRKMIAQLPSYKLLYEKLPCEIVVEMDKI